MVIKKIFNYIFTHKIFTLLVVSFCCFIMFSFNNESSAHSDYYNSIETFTSGKPWVLYHVSGVSSDRLFIAVSPDTRKARTINNYGTANGVSYGLVGFTETYDTDYWIKNNVYELVFSNGDFTGNFNGPNYDYAWNTILGRYADIVDINYSTYDYNNNIVYNVSDFENTDIDPYITNSTSDIESWSFNTLNISGNIDMYYEYEDAFLLKNLTLYLKFNGYWYYMNVEKYFSDTNPNILGNWLISIPKEDLFNNYFYPVNSSSTNVFLQDRNFVLGVGGISYNGENIDSSHDTAENYDLGTFDITIPVGTAQDINGQSNSNQQQEIINQQQQMINQQKETNNNLNNISSSLTDDSIDNTIGESMFDFQTDVTGFDIVSSLNSLFNIVINAFTVGEPVDITFTFPFTNRVFTIPYNYTEVHVPFSVRAIFSLVWLGLASLWCFKRVYTVYDFIKSGDFDLVFKDGNVKKEAL